MVKAREKTLKHASKRLKHVKTSCLKVNFAIFLFQDVDTASACSDATPPSSEAREAEEAGRRA